MSGVSKATKWEEQEKVALLISIIAASGPPNWKKVDLPEGRSKMACMHVYMAAVKEAQRANLGDNKSSDSAKKRAPKNAASGNAKGALKRKRGKKDDKSSRESEVSEDEERKPKKLKDDDEGKTVKLEAEEV